MQPKVDLADRPTAPHSEDAPAAAAAAPFASRQGLLPYVYQARAADGKRVSGTQMATDELDLDARLNDKGLVLISAKRGSRVTGAASVRLNRVELISFASQLATMLRAGVPLINSLRQICQRATAKNTRTVVGEIIRDLEGGLGFSDALDNHPRSFPMIFRASVRAGERSTGLPDVLKRQAVYMRWVREIRQTTIQALVYPGILMLAIVFLILVLVTFMLPRLMKLYPGGAEDLPAQTRQVMAMSDFMSSNWIGLLVALAGAIGGAVVALRRPAVRLVVSRVLLRLPRLGHLLAMISTSRFANTASTLYEAGCDVVGTFTMAADSCGNAYMRETYLRALARVERGTSITDALEREPSVDPFLIQLTAIGETSGDLGGSLRHLSDAYDEEVPRTVKWALSLIEPGVLIVGGGVVLYVLLAALLPIVTLYEKIG